MCVACLLFAIIEKQKQPQFQSKATAIAPTLTTMKIILSSLLIASAAAFTKKAPVKENDRRKKTRGLRSNRKLGTGDHGTYSKCSQQGQ
jgi:hypothetical protein